MHVGDAGGRRKGGMEGREGGREGGRKEGVEMIKKGKKIIIQRKNE